MNTEDCYTRVGSMIKDITELCDFCNELTELIVGGEDFGTTIDQPNRIEEFVPGRGLESCQLCEVISSAGRTTPANLRTSLIGVRGEMRCYSDERWARLCGRRIGGTEFRIWADIGSSACKTLIDRPPISDLPMHQVRDLIQHWRKRCRDHKHCQLEAKMPMPTRVLAICGDHARPSIMLVKSKGMKGRHCWGSVEKQPLRTTPANLEIHHKGIAFEDLPRTFQNFVGIAQSIGIKYFWIDSLCIIQGDSQDWHSEAAKMGDVYRNAALVIADSGAGDSSRGLFINDRSLRTVFGVRGTFNMMQSPDESDWHPRHGPLETQAWTLQERYLAQRLITFMPRGLTWCCKTMSVDEAGRSIWDFGRTENWYQLLREYTKRSLTFPSDRTEAIRGVAEDLCRWSRKDRYVPDYGVWEDDLVEQLLWSKDRRYYDDSKLPNKPSWSWVATGSAKVWPLGFGGGHLRPYLETMPEESLITHEGHLHILGHLSTAKPAPSYVRDEYIARDLQIPRKQQIYPLWPEHYDMYSQVLTQDINDGYDQINLGSACFDNDSAMSYSHACFLGKQRNAWSPGKQRNADKSWHDSHPPRPSVKRELIEDIVYHTEHDSEFIYWALLLEQVDDSKFKRVGIAALLPVAYQAFQVQLQSFEII